MSVTTTTTTTFQGFLESSFESSSSSSSLNEPSLQQMAALAAYSKAAMIAQREQKVFTPTIYSQIASMVLTQRYPAVFFGDKFYPLCDLNNTIDNDETISDNNDSNIDDTKEFDSSTGSEDTSDMLQTSFQEVSNENTKLFSTIQRSPVTKTTQSSSPLTIVSTQKSKRERKQQYTCITEASTKDIQFDEEERKAAADDDDVVNDNEDTDNEEDEDGPPVLEKYDSTPLTLKTNEKILKKKNDSFIVPSTTPDGFKHPKKVISYDKIDTPQLLPNGVQKTKKILHPTQPLEEWFLSNLTNPFPSQKQFNHLQYASNLGHLDIRQWFQSRRKIFCKYNPKSRPWSKKAVSMKRLSSSSASAEENVEEKNLTDEIVSKKLKTIKLEVSELEFW